MTIETGPKGPTAIPPASSGATGVKNKSGPSADAKAEGFTAIFATQQEAQQKPSAEASAHAQDGQDGQDDQDGPDERKMQNEKNKKGLKNSKTPKVAKGVQDTQDAAAQAPLGMDAVALLAQSLQAQSLSDAARDSAGAPMQNAVALEGTLGKAGAGASGLVPTVGLALGQSADALQKSTAQALARAASAKTGANSAADSAATTLADSGAGALPVPEAQAEVEATLDATLAQTVKALSAQIRNAAADQSAPGVDTRSTGAAQAELGANALQGPQAALAKKQALADTKGLQSTVAQALEQRRSDAAQAVHLGREQALRGAEAGPELAPLQALELQGNKPEAAYAAHSVFAPTPLLHATGAQEAHGAHGHIGGDYAGAAPAAAPTPEMGNPDAVKYWISPDVKNAQLQVGGLGEQPLDVRISMRGNEAQVAFLTNETPTRDALQDASAQLQDMFQREGVLLGGVSVGGAPSQGFGAGGGAQQSQRDGKRPPSGVAGLSPNARSNALAHAATVRIAPTQANGLAGKGRSLDLFV